MFQFIILYPIIQEEYLPFGASLSVIGSGAISNIINSNEASFCVIIYRNSGMLWVMMGKEYW